MTDKIVFLDIETGGLNPRHDEIVEVAMIKRTDKAPGADMELQFSLNINPDRANPEALKINRYWQRRAELADMQVSDGLAAALLWAALRDAVVVGNNVQFDLRFIEQFLIVNSFQPSGIGNDFSPTPWSYHPVDIKALVAGRLGLGEPPWSTKRIARESGVPLPEDAHSAFADATWNRDVYDAMFHSPRTRCACGVDLPHRIIELD